MPKVLFEKTGRIGRITLNRPEVMNAAEVVENVPAADVTEGCAGGTTARRLIRFALLTHNDGPDDLVIGDPLCPNCLENPGAVCGNELFVCSIAHDHPHFDSFAAPQLFDANGALVAEGRKQGFCFLDSVCASRHFISCSASSSVSAQSTNTPMLATGSGQRSEGRYWSR